MTAARTQESAPLTLAQKVGFGVSVLVILSLAGLVVYADWERGQAPTVVEARPALEAVYRQGKHFYLPIEVTNRGGAAAEQINIEVTLEANGETESSVLTVAQLAARESRRGWLVFRLDPGAATLTTALGFLEP